MSDNGEANWDENLTFKWGMKKRVDHSNKDFQFYESFMLDNVKYFLYDSVYIYQEGFPEAHIGKLVDIYETLTLGKGAKVVWFLRPIDIRNFLMDYEPSWNEIFLASGEGQGLSDIIPLGAIIGKCNVICTSNDWRNPQATREDLCKADYIFCRTFDVAKYTIEENFPDKINGVKVEHFFNRIKDLALASPCSSNTNDRKWSGKSSSSSKLLFEKAVGAVKDGNSGIKVSSVVKERGKAALNVDKQGFYPSYNTELRPETSVAKFTVEGSSKKNIDGVRERTRKSSSSPGLGMEKAVAGVNGGNFGIRINPVVKESKKRALNVDKQTQLPSSNSTLRPKTSVAKCGTGLSSAEKNGLKVEHHPNGRQDQGRVSPFNSKGNVKQWTGKSSLSSRLRLDKAVESAVKNGNCGNIVRSRFKEKAVVILDKKMCIAIDDTTLRPHTSDEGGSGRGRINCCQVENKAKRILSWDITPRSASDIPLKKRKLPQDEKASNDLDKSAAQLVQNRCTETESPRRPDYDRSNWFKQLQPKC